MSWKMRTGKSSVIPKGRWAPDYGPGDNNFSITFHHRGKFNEDKTRCKGGRVDYFDFCNSDELSLIELKGMASLCGIFGSDVVYYISKTGRNSCKELVKMEVDSDVLSMYLYVDSSGCVGVFVEGGDKDCYETGDEQENGEGVTQVDEHADVGDGFDGGDFEFINEELDEEQADGGDREYENNEETQRHEESQREIVTQVDSVAVDELFQCLRDEKDMYVPEEDDQSVGSDSVNSDGDQLVDSDCDVANEDPEFYKNVTVDIDLGGIHSSSTPTVQLPNKSTTLVATEPRKFQGFTVFNSATELENPKFEYGQLFEGPDIFRAAIKAYSIKNGKKLKYGHNERTRIGLHCESDGCPFKIYAASYKNHGPHTLQVRQLVDEHKCGRLKKLRAATSTWMAEEYGDFIQTIKKWNVKSMQSITLKRSNVQLSKHQMYRARNRVCSEVNGSANEQYDLMYNYGAELVRSDSDNTVKIVSLKRPDDTELFKRIYICWGPMKKGFAEGLRKFICMDGCHLKTINGGILLTAIALDPNNNMYHVAYAIVEKEKTDTWRWFLEYLKEDLKIPDGGEGWTFMSDKQKGLINSVEALFVKCEHRNCVVHLYKNFKLSHSGLALQLLVWKAAKSTRIVDFKETLQEMKEKDVKAAAWLEARPAEHWSRSYFKPNAKTDVVVNNISESYNGLIRESRGKPIIEFLEDLRILTMKRVWTNHQQMVKWWGNYCPNIVEKMEMHNFKSNNLQCVYNGEDEFEVTYITGGPNSWQVELNARRCSCRKWQLTGIPCSHAYCCIKYVGKNEADYVDQCYTKSLYMKVYSHCLHVIRGRNEWPDTKKKLLPPVPEKMSGRPKKYARKKSLQEIQDQKARMAIAKAKLKQNGHLGRDGMIMTCSYCKTPGHNKQGCLKRKAAEMQSEEDAANGVKRSKNVVANTQEAIQTAAKKTNQKRKEKLPVKKKQ